MFIRQRTAADTYKGLIIKKDRERTEIYKTNTTLIPKNTAGLSITGM